MRHEIANQDVTMIDLLHVSGEPHRFAPGDTVRAAIIGHDAQTGEPTVLAHRTREEPTDHQVKILAPMEGEARYTVELLEEQAVGSRQ